MSSGTLNNSVAPSSIAGITDQSSKKWNAQPNQSIRGIISSVSLCQTNSGKETCQKHE
jgi:hypothetical protein